MKKTFISIILLVLSTVFIYSDLQEKEKKSGTVPDIVTVGERRIILRGDYVEM